MLLPIGDDNEGRQITPIVNYTLIGINIVVFILELINGDAFQIAYSAIPYAITHPAAAAAGVRVPGIGIVTQPQPVYLTILTSMFMHAGWLHIGGNMLYLWIFGDNVEDNFGHIKYLIFYLLCGFAASFAQIAVDPNSKIPSLGASGAIAGVLGSYIIMFPGNKVRTILPLGFIWTIVRLPAIVVIGLWIILQLFSQVASISNTGSHQQGGVAYMAHIGGFFAGLILTFFFRTPTNRRGPPNTYREEYYRGGGWPN